MNISRVTCYVILTMLQDGETALHGAASNGHFKTCEVLLKHNANAQAEDEVRNYIKTEPHLRNTKYEDTTDITDNKLFSVTAAPHQKAQTTPSE